MYLGAYVLQGGENDCHSLAVSHVEKQCVGADYLIQLTWKYLYKIYLMNVIALSLIT